MNHAFSRQHFPFTMHSHTGVPGPCCYLFVRSCLCTEKVQGHFLFFLLIRRQNHLECLCNAFGEKECLLDLNIIDTKALWSTNLGCSGQGEFEISSARQHWHVVYTMIIQVGKDFRINSDSPERRFWVQPRWCASTQDGMKCCAAGAPHRERRKAMCLLVINAGIPIALALPGIAR